MTEIRVVFLALKLDQVSFLAIAHSPQKDYLFSNPLLLIFPLLACLFSMECVNSQLATPCSNTLSIEAKREENERKKRTWWLLQAQEGGSEGVETRKQAAEKLWAAASILSRVTEG